MVARERAVANTRWRTLTAPVVSCALALAVLAGCSQPSPGAPAQSPSSIPTTRLSTTPTTSLSGVTEEQALAYTQIMTELTDFLDAWKTKGYVDASKAYLAPGLQATSADDVLVLASGGVVNVRPDEWTSKDLFVVSVDFDLTFRGSVGAWGNGRSSRFVTATARTGTIPYVLDFATGR